MLEIDLAGEPTTIGIVADKVYEVTDLDTSTLQKAPPIGMRWRPGIHRRDRQMEGRVHHRPEHEADFELR